MAVEMAKTRQFSGHDHNGDPVYVTTFESGPRKPESIPEWLEQRRAALYPWTSHRHVAVALELLEQAVAGPPGAAPVKAAGKDLTPEQRYAAGLMLVELARLAQYGYAPALPVARRVVAAWVKCWGDRQPKVPNGTVIGVREAQTAGTGLVTAPPWYGYVREAP